MLGCRGAAAGWPVPQTSSPAESLEPPRRPDAVSIDLPPALPIPVERAACGGVVALREPLADHAVTDVVLALLHAWEYESIDELVDLLTDDAGPIEARGRGRGALVDSWRQRLRLHEYHLLAGMDLVHPQRIERYGWNDLSAPRANPRPPDMRPDELYVRVPLEVTRVAGDHLFGSVLLLLLRRHGDGGYKIAAYGEIDAP